MKNKTADYLHNCGGQDINCDLKLFPFIYFSLPFQQSGYIPLEAGKYYWIEALHKEGARRDSLSVGYTLVCPNAPNVLSEKPILKPSLQYKIPRKYTKYSPFFNGELQAYETSSPSWQ